MSIISIKYIDVSGNLSSWDPEVPTVWMNFEDSCKLSADHHTRTQAHDATQSLNKRKRNKNV